MNEWGRGAEEFSDMESIEKRVREVESKTNLYVAKILPAEFENKVKVVRSETPSTSVPVGALDFMWPWRHTSLQRALP